MNTWKKLNEATISCTGKFKYDMIWKISYISENKKRNYNFRHPPCNGTERRFPVVPAFTSWGLVDPAALLVMLGEGGGDHCHWDGSDENATQHWNLIKAVETNHDSHHFFLSKKNGWKLEAEKWRSCFWGLSSGLSFFVSHRYPSTGANFFGKKEKWLSITWLLFSSQNECWAPSHGPLEFKYRIYSHIHVFIPLSVCWRSLFGAPWLILEIPTCINSVCK